MSVDYFVLERRALHRLRSAESRLSRIYLQWQNGLARCKHSAEEIALLQQLDGMESLPGSTVDRGRLFACLRRTAINRRRHQDLCLQLRLLEQDTRQQEQAWQMQRQHCRTLQAKLEKLKQLLRQHRRQRESRRLDHEEAELQERTSWNC